jgi:hypothetical protein
MWRLCYARKTVLCGRSCLINVLWVIKLAVKILRPNRVNGPTVDMSRFWMTMIRIGMDMKQRNHEHPHGRPDQDSHPRPRERSKIYSHVTISLARFSTAINRTTSLHFEPYAYQFVPTKTTSSRRRRIGSGSGRRPVVALR